MLDGEDWLDESDELLLLSRTLDCEEKLLRLLELDELEKSEASRPELEAESRDEEVDPEIESPPEVLELLLPSQQQPHRMWPFFHQTCPFFQPMGMSSPP